MYYILGIFYDVNNAVAIEYIIYYVKIYIRAPLLNVRTVVRGSEYPIYFMCLVPDKTREI